KVFPDAARRVKAMKWGNFVACAGGRNADINKLHEITDTVLLMDDVSEETLRGYFEWVSGSIVSSMSPDGKQPSLPRGVNLVKPPRVS
ncbi:MAG: hypothetical protein IKR84_04520, partial [Oscillibacter sp.]|nr:hypothetical protein [Oscillibacter sp.]